MSGGSGYTALWVHEVSLNCTLKNKMVKKKYKVYLYKYRGGRGNMGLRFWSKDSGRDDIWAGI